MNYRALGKSGIEVSEIGYGAWAIGGGMWGGARDDDARPALRHAIERGVNLIDTALVYGMGHSENLVGELLRERREQPGARELYVATKAPPKNLQWPSAADANVADVFPRAHLRASCEQSLKNLGVERIDLYQLHVFSERWVDQDEWYETLLALKQEGKIRLIGVSVNDNDPASALRLAASGRVDALQVIYNVFDQSPADALFTICQAHGVGILARVPLDEGSLTGKLTPETKFPAGDFRNRYFGGGLLQETVDRVEKLRPILAPADSRSPASLTRAALRFCLSHPAVSSVIPGMRTLAQVDDNTSASTDGPLTPEQLTALKPHRWIRPSGI